MLKLTLKQGKQTIVCFAGIVVVCVLVSSCCCMTTTRERSATLETQIGQKVRLKTQTSLTLTTQDLSSLIEALNSKDEHGFNELLFSGRIFAVPSGTTLLVIDTSLSLFPYSAIRVRVVDGQQAGKAGWTIRDLVE